MRCWHCNSELIWGGDHDIEDDFNDNCGIVTNLSCTACDAWVEVYKRNASVGKGKTVYSKKMTTCDEGTEK